MGRRRSRTLQQPEPPLRLTPIASEPILRVFLDPRRLLRWVYLGRAVLVTAILLAAVLVWEKDADQSKLLVASVAFAITTLWTLSSIWYTEIYRRPITPSFSYLQTAYDMVLVTAVVHLTGGGTSQFSALYILVVAVASLIQPAGGGLLTAALGIALYVADAIWLQASDPSAAVWLQLSIIAVVAIGSASIGAKLQQAGVGREELAATLTHARHQAADILHNIRAGVITIDAAGQLVYANPSAGQLLGIALEAELGRSIGVVLASAAPDLAQALEDAARQGTRTTRGEATVTDGARRFPIGITTTYVERPDKSGTPAARTATAIFQDISDLKRLEQLRLRTQRLEGVAELSASLAHEIKNPLASIRSAVEQLSKMPRASDDEQTLASLVLRESDRLSRLLSEFLDFARVRVARSEPVDVRQLVTGAVRLVEAHPDRLDGVTLKCEIAADDGLTVDGDDDLLHRAVFNLLLNAVQATPAGGCVTVTVGDPTRAERVPGGIRAPRDAVAIRVSDSGAGIPMEIRERLFDPFFTTKPGGSGLGLAVVHRAIEAHRGFVLVDSSAQGTRFTVVVPRTADKPLTTVHS
ncbi:MAG: PAS domain-containing protein [Gemmatimonadaceae bacterium]|nr:PAS domain-containing protein [Gemmatimonadaceae bacterium]